MYSYLGVFDDLLIVSNTRVREEASWESKKPKMDVFSGLSKELNQAIRLFLKSQERIDENDFVHTVIPGLPIRAQRRPMEKDTIVMLPQSR
jgi:hypothetical protein